MQETFIWWEPFINQLAHIAVDNGVDATTDEGFEWCTCYMVLTASLN